MPSFGFIFKLDYFFTNHSILNILTILVILLEIFRLAISLIFDMSWKKE
jgi:hypothetical protein